MATRLVVLLTVVVAVCSTTALAASAAEPPNPTDPRIVSGSAQKALDRARTRWRRAKIRSYRFEAKRTCFCPTSGWHEVSVRGGVPSATTPSDVKQIATVPRLFLVIQQAIRRKAHELTVTYGSHGLPTQISIDSIANVVDEEQYFYVRHFARS
jgi:hypothetical protein